MCKKFVMDYHNKIKLIHNFEKTTFYDLAKQKFKICRGAPRGGDPERNIMNVVKQKCIRSMSTMFTEMCRNYSRPHHF